MLSRHDDVCAAFNNDAPREVVQDALNRLVIETSRVAILVTDTLGKSIAAGVQNPDAPNPFADMWDTRSMTVSPATLSRRFVLNADQTWMFEIAKGITGQARAPLEQRA